MFQIKPSFVFVFFSFTVQLESVRQPPKLLLVSLDGLRYDFITPQRTPSLWSLSRQGVYLESGLKSQFYTITAPNHYSMVTGLHQESHGIIENKFWDPDSGETYDIWNNTMNDTLYERSKLAYWYKGTTPIWQTNEDEKYSRGYTAKYRRRSASFYFPMGDCYINNKTIFRNFTWPEYGNKAAWEKEIDTVISWLTDPKEPVNFVLYYNGEPDGTSHHNDVFGSEVKSVVSDVDAAMGYLVERLREASLWDEVNLIVTSDHGHATVPNEQYVISVSDYVDREKVIMNGVTLFPRPGTGVTEEEIYANLTRAKQEMNLPMHVWRKKEFPRQYHYSDNRRIGPVIMCEDQPYFVSIYGPVGRKFPFSTHGWLNIYPEMRGFFIAYGPAFKSALRVKGREDIENIDLYPLMCKVLGIDPLPNNGSFDRIKFILRADLQ